MGLKDQGDGTSHILELEYLHVHHTAPPGTHDGAQGVGDKALPLKDQAPRGAEHRTLQGTPGGGHDDASQRAAGAQEGAAEEQCSRSVSPFDSEDEPGTSWESRPSAPPSDQRSKVDFALKLGYSQEQVHLVLQKLGPAALTNDILGELVKFGHRPESQAQAGDSSVALPPTPLSSLHQWTEDKNNLRPVVLDGSNVAMSHGNKEVFSCQGIQLAVDWFLDRGHHDITVFVPAWRKEQSRPDAPITEQEILRRLEKQKILVFTPSRRVQGRRVVCYDDRFIVKLAHESDGIIVSNDNYRDLANEKPEWKRFIDQRLLMYSFVNDKFMPPDDPLGRHGPSLDNFLRKRPIVPENRRQPCPYGKKCTYGHKCKFYHPERGSQPQRAVADELRASAKISSVSRSLMEDTRSGTSQSLLEEEGREHWQSTPKKQSFSILRSSLTDLCDERRKGQSRRGSGSSSSSSSSSGCSSFLGYPAPLSPGGLDRWDLLGTGSCTSEALKSRTDPRCESPEAGYSSMVKAYSGLSLEFTDRSDQFPTLPDLRSESLFSDCSSEGSANIVSPDLTTDSGPRAYPLHGRYPCPPTYPGRFKEKSPLVFAQDMPKQYSLETNLTYEESTSFQTSSVGHRQHSPRGPPQDLPTQEYSSSFKDLPSSAASHRSLLSFAKGYHTGFTLSSFEEMPSMFHSQSKLSDPALNPVSNQHSPQSTCRGVPRHGKQTQFDFEHPSPVSSSKRVGLNQHSPPAYPPGLRQRGFDCFEELPPCLERPASHLLFQRSDLSESYMQTYPSGESHHSYPSPAPSHLSFSPRTPHTHMSPKGFQGDFHSVPPKTPRMPPLQLSPHHGYSHRSQPWEKPQPWEKLSAHDWDMHSGQRSARFSPMNQAQANWNVQQPYKAYHLFGKNTDVATGLSPTAPQPSALDQYRDVREKLFSNLCGVFPAELVRHAMATNPHTLDAQELAATILLAKSQCLT